MLLLVIFILSLKALITTKIVCFCRLPKCFRNHFNKHYRPRPSESTLFVSILTLVNNVSKYTQQTTLADNVFRCSFFCWRLRVNALSINIGTKNDRNPCISHMPYSKVILWGITSFWWLRLLSVLRRWFCCC